MARARQHPGGGTPGPVGTSSPPPGTGPGIPGLALAGVTALVSGVSVFVNSHGVKAVAQPAVYTTAKNLVATLVLVAATGTAATWRARRAGGAAGRWVDPPRRTGTARSRGPARVAALAYVGLVGGGVAFILFFDGLARTTATPAAFLHGTLVLWVALLAALFLRERISLWNVAAVALLFGGEVAITHGTGGLSANAGQLMVLVATLLWAVEIVVAKRLLADLAPAAVGLVRMGVGSLALLAYLAVTGALGSLFTLGAGQLGWVALTGLLLACYVGTWFSALARARAVDVTSMLVAAALVTAMLQAGTGVPVSPEALGLCLIAMGTVVLAASGARRVPA